MRIEGRLASGRKAIIVASSARGEQRSRRDEHRQRGDSGEAIDYGPCAFVDTYDRRPSSASSTRPAATLGPPATHGRLEPGRAGRTLLPLLGPNQTAAIELADQAIASFAPRFESAHLIGLRRKLGLKTEQEGDDELIQDLLSHMQEGGADWTLTFRALADAAEGNAAPARAVQPQRCMGRLG